MAQDRRRFLATCGAAVLGASWPYALAGLLADRKQARIPRIGIQLYTVRRLASANLGATLARLATIGFKEVELAGSYNQPAKSFRTLLERNGLTAPSGHIALELIEKDPLRTFDDAHTIGHEWITVPSLPRGQHESKDDWKRVAERFNGAASTVKAAGFRFAFHNHNDIVRSANGILPVDILMRETDPSLVFYQMDIYWAVSGGADPVGLLTRYPGRFRMVHVKDGRPPYTDASQTDLGQGTIDFRRIFAAAKDTEHYFMESDSASDPMQFAKSGYQFLNKLEWPSS